MSDRYGELVQSKIGKTVAKNLGLPTPTRLDRYQVGQPVLRGEVVLGGQKGVVYEKICQILDDLDAKITHLDTQDTLQAESRYKVAMFDVSAIKTTDELQALYAFFHKVAKQIKTSGRVILVAQDFHDLADIHHAAVQRAVLGFAKSFAKECKNGITVNVVYVGKDALAHLPHTLHFLLSAKSAYVSGQAIYLSAGQVPPVEINSSKPLTAKKILVTGASRGIGQAVAEVLARDGAVVYCLDVPQNKDELEKVAQQIGGVALTLDITTPDAGEKIAKACGVLDGVVHNAGITKDKTLAKMSVEQWDSVLSVNLTAILNINDYLFSHDRLSEFARLVCVSSISGIAGNLGQTNYATSKAGVIGLVEATAKSLQNSHQRINAVAPGFIETKMTAAIPFAIREAGRRMNAMSQGGEPIDVAETISWLLSPKAGGLNGNIIRVCGQSILGA